MARHATFVELDYSCWPSPTPKASKHPVLLQKAASLSKALARLGGIVPSCVTDACIEPTFVDGRIRATVVSIRDILLPQARYVETLQRILKAAWFRTHKINPAEQIMRRIAALRFTLALSL